MNHQTPEASHGTLTSYVMGYLLSLELTVAAYLLAVRHVNSHHLLFAHRTLVGGIALLAVTQLMVQLFFFLHLSRESRPRWNLIVLLFAAMVLGIVVFGSLWIMHNLNYHTETPDQINKYIQSQSDL
jgi:cytochrome o ubiquinol oxidase operon protein cyoD